MKRYTPETIPHSAEYIGSTEGPDTISEELADRIDDTIAPAYIQDEDGHKHFFELCIEAATDNDRATDPTSKPPQGAHHMTRNLYEVIWSKFDDAYISRSVSINSTIKPLFIGTLEKCASYIAKNLSR